jgi:hypothetical protein
MGFGSESLHRVNPQGGRGMSGPFDAFDAQEAFSGFAPWARHVADNHHAQSATYYRFFYA